MTIKKPYSNLFPTFLTSTHHSRTFWALIFFCTSNEETLNRQSWRPSFSLLIFLASLKVEGVLETRGCSSHSNKSAGTGEGQTWRKSFREKQTVTNPTRAAGATVSTCQQITSRLKMVNWFKGTKLLESPPHFLAACANGPSLLFSVCSHPVCFLFSCFVCGEQGWGAQQQFVFIKFLIGKNWDGRPEKTLNPGKVLARVFGGELRGRPGTIRWLTHPTWGGKLCEPFPVGLRSV